MSGTALVYDFSGLSRLTERIARLARADKRRLLDDLGAAAESQTRRRIDDEKEGPRGEEWPAWSDDYAATRHAGHSLLVAEGHLGDSMTHVVHGNESVEVGGNLIYGAVHQFGYEERGIPARPHLGVSAENEEDLEEIADRFLDRMVSR